ncbi:MAG: flavodoxin [bacterium]|nr:flavodoxin [bacterium]
MRVLVTYGSKMGSTVDIAETIAGRLNELGFATEVAPARDYVDPCTFDAVIVGGALYAGRWVKEARRYVKRFGPDLRPKPVWLFSSGPLDDSASEQEIPPTWHVKAAMKEANARGHATFGGRLDSDARGFMASGMARTNAGDWRDTGQIVAWATGIGTTLAAHDAA